jgi:hypothetical protein
MEKKNGEEIFKKIMEIFVFSGLFPHLPLCTKENYFFLFCNVMRWSMGGGNQIPLLTCSA